MSAIAIITARGASKRIPKKNIREFCGMPVISYSIAAALDAGCFDEVMVSTDSAEIAQIAERYGAKIPFMRSESASSDQATTADAVKEVLRSYIEKQNRSFDVLCCLYPTAPFVTAEKIKKGMDIFYKSHADSVIPVVQFSFPPQRAFVIEHGILKYQYPEYALVRSQDLQPVYHDSGQFYICRTTAFLRQGTLVTSDARPFILPEEEVQDIDNFSDWNIAELKYKKFILKEEC